MNALEMVTMALAIIGAITGIGGLVPGVRNHRHSLRESRTRIRVLPKLAFPGPLDEMVTQTYYSEEVERALSSLKAYVCIEVKNLSATPQTILELGVVLGSGDRIPWREPEWGDADQSVPLTLGADEVGAAYLRIVPDEDDQFAAVVYAKTDCGDYFEGDSPILNDFLERLSRRRSQSDEEVA